MASRDGGFSSRFEARLYEGEEGEGEGVRAGVGMCVKPLEGPGEEVYKVVSSVILSMSHFFRCEDRASGIADVGGVRTSKAASMSAWVSVVLRWRKARAAR